MPKTVTLQSNFTGGELSPFLLGRVDIAKYHSGVARMQDYHPIVQGGAVSRDGSLLVGMAKGRGLLIPFVFDRANAWQIELGTDLGAGYLRIWRADRGAVMDGGSPLELATPFSELVVSELTYEQADDTMFFFHPSLPPHRLVRRTATLWTFEAVPFITQPTSETGYSVGIDLTLSSAAVGSVSVSTGLPLFVKADIGRELVDPSGGHMVITAVADSTHATATIDTAFGSTLVTGWTLLGSPLAYLAADRKTPVGGVANLYGAIARAANLTLSAMTGSITINADAGIFVAGDTGKRLFATDGGEAILTYVSATQVTGAAVHDFSALAYLAGDFAVQDDTFRLNDIGRIVSVNGGSYRVTGYVDATRLSAEILVSPSALVAAPPGSWTLNGNEFTAERGYPASGTLGEQRLWLGGSEAEPTEIWGSRIAEYLDFTPGTGDADGLAYSLNTHQRNPIRHLVFTERLFVFTSGHEASVRGGNEKAIGPTNIQKKDSGRYGCNGVRPVVVGAEILFVQGAGRKVRAMGWAADQDNYVSPDRTVFAEHITKSGIVAMAFQSEPDSLLYAVRADGVMAVAAYDVAQEVIAWSRFTTAGSYLSVSVVPRPTRDDVWTIVNRPDAGGAARYFIEVFDPIAATDCGNFFNVGDGGVPIDHIDGLDRFEGLALAVRADDANFGPLTVTGGRITLPRPAHGYIEAGLPFVPTLELLPPDFGGNGGTAQGSNLSVNEVVVRVLDTQTLEINGELSDFRHFGTALLDQPPPSFTGDYRAFKLTDDIYKDVLVIRQPLPFRCHVQAVIRKCTVNDT